MDLPAIMVSNMLAQDSHLLSGQLPTVSPCHPPWFLLGHSREGSREGAECQCLEEDPLLGCRVWALSVTCMGVHRIWGVAWRDVYAMLLASEALFIISWYYLFYYYF